MSLIHKALQRAEGERSSTGGDDAGGVHLPPMPPPRRSLVPLLGIVLVVAGGVAGVRWWTVRAPAEPTELPQSIAALTPEQVEAAKQKLAAQVAADGDLPADVAPQVHEGEAFFQAGKWDESLAKFSAAAEQHPKVAQLWNNVGIAQKKLGKLAEADTAYGKALELQPDYPEALNNRGALKIVQGDPLTAALLLRKAIDLNPKYADAYFNLAVLMEDEGNWRSAVEAYKSFLEYTTIDDPAFREQVTQRVEEITP